MAGLNQQTLRHITHDKQKLSRYLFIMKFAKTILNVKTSTHKNPSSSIEISQSLEFSLSSPLMVNV